MSNFLKNQYLWLIIIVLLGFLVRLYKIDNPIADWHSWRQADTAAVARNFFKEGYNPFFPKYDDMSGVADDPLPNPNRYRFVEFPIYNSLVYFAYLANGGVSEKLARLVSAFISLGSIIFLYFIVAYNWNKKRALMAAFLMAVLPFNVYFSRVVLPESTLVFFSLGMFYFVNRWIYEDNRRLYFIGLFFAMGAFLTKPSAIFYLLPLVYSYYQKEGCLWPIPKRYYAFLIPALAPFLLWRLWILQHPEGIPASGWLFNGDGIRYKPAFWKWILGDRLGREILSVAGTILLFLGVLFKPLIGEGKLLHWLALSAIAYLLVFATGNVRHDYYQVLIVPVLIIFVVRGFWLLVGGVNGLIPRIFTIPLGILLLFLTLYLTFPEVKGLYQINNGVIIEAGMAADKILPKNAIVAAPYNGDTAFLYQINRSGWPFIAYPMDDLINFYGVTHYVSVNYDQQTKDMMERYTVMEANPGFVIIDLAKPNPNWVDKFPKKI